MMACFFLNVDLYIIFIYHVMYVCVCVRVCVRACMPGDITLLTAEMGFLESVFEDHYSRPLSSNNITLTVATESDISIRQTSC